MKLNRCPYSNHWRIVNSLHLGHLVLRCKPSNLVAGSTFENVRQIKPHQVKRRHRIIRIPSDARIYRASRMHKISDIWTGS